MEKANFGQIVSFLFGIANDCLVDTYDVGDYRKIILPMMVIRRFDAVLEPTKEKVLKMKEQLDAAGITDQDEALCSVAGEAFCNSSPYTLSDLKSRTNQQQLKSDFILYLNGFSQNVQDIHTEVIAKGKVGGKARAMVITSSIKRAIEYYKAVSKLLEERKSPFKAIVAFSGSVEYEGKHVTEADLNGFPSAKIEKTFKGDPYRILIVANKFQTGFDEPLLHTMYVDKGLADIKAVQTLSRLNRSHPDKKDTFILDFVNEPGVIKEAFDRYYKTTILSGETDVNKLNDLIDTMESIQVYSDADVDTFVERYLADEPRDRLDPILDHCVEVYEGLIIEDQIEFKSCAKTFVRTYNFLSAILPYGSVQWEKLSIFLNLLIPKLPKPEGEDYTEGLLEDVDLESYRAEAQQTMRIQLENENGEIDPIPVSTSVGVDVPELDTLTNILKEFHDIFGNIEWTDEDKIKKQINDIIESVRRDEKYNNAMQFSDKQNARDESDRAAHEAVMNQSVSCLCRIFS